MTYYEFLLDTAARTLPEKWLKEFPEVKIIEMCGELVVCAFIRGIAVPLQFNELEQRWEGMNPA